MLDIIFVILFIFNIILMLYATQERSIAYTLSAGIIWLILALFIVQGIEIPYEMYNATSGHIETGVHTIRTYLDPLSYLFGAFGLIMFVLGFTYMLEAMTDMKKIR